MCACKRAGGVCVCVSMLKVCVCVYKRAGGVCVCVYRCEASRSARSR